MRPSNNHYLAYPVAPKKTCRMQIQEICKTLSAAGIAARHVDLSSLVAYRHADFVYPPSVSNRANQEIYEAIHNALMDSLGPYAGQGVSSKPINRNRIDLNLSDARAATSMYEIMHLMPVQAGNPQMWETLTAFMFPEYAVQRFSSDSGTIKAITERFVGGRRNALWRLWFRRHVIPLELEERFQKILSQDLVQQIIDRTSLASDPRLVAESLALIAEYAQDSEVSRTFYRELFKEVALLGGVCVPQALSDVELHSVLAQRAEQIANALSG